MIESDYIIGKCDTMCPQSEVELRKKHKLVHYFEIEQKIMIKEFSRSAADKQKPSPKDIRTEVALHKTLDFLFNK